MSCSPASGAEGYRFEPYRAYHKINNLAGLAFPSVIRGQAGDKFSAGWAPDLGPFPPHVGRSNGLRLSGRRKPVRCSRGLSGDGLDGEQAIRRSLPKEALLWGRRPTQVEDKTVRVPQIATGD
jgi:hypothetical protein